MINRAYVIGFLVYVSALIYIRTLYDTRFLVVLLIIFSFIVSTINFLIVYGFWKSPRAELRNILLCLFAFIGLYTGGQAVLMYVNRKAVYNMEKLAYQDIGYFFLTTIFVWLLNWIYKKKR